MSDATTGTRGEAERTDSPSRAFVLGLDGVPWDLIDGWVDDEELPNFSRMVAEGAAGPLRSTVPPTTPLAWPSIATGTWADKHGVYGFKRLSRSYQQRMYSSEDVAQPELWDLVSPALVGNVPMTYPATEMDGKLVAGMMSPSMDRGFTHPPELAAEIRERIPDYDIGLSWSEYTGRQEEFLADLTTLVEARRELMRLLMETGDWRLFFYVYTAPDRLQHLVWDESVLLEHYKLLDDILGEVLDYVAANDAVLFVVSDHGFGPISKFVYVNRVLEEAGYLVREGDAGTRGVLSRLGVSKDRVRSAMGTIGLSEDTVVRYLPESVVDTVAEQVPGDHELYDIDHARTKAFVFGSGTLYVNDTRRFEKGTVDPADVPLLKRELEGVFADVTDPETGERALDVFDGAEVFPTDDDGPDLVVRGRGEYQKATSLTDTVFAPTRGMEASHRSEGIVLAWGPSIQPESTPVDASVTDICPTVLHSLGEPVGETMDGRVLTEFFHPDSPPARRPIETRAYGADSAGSSGSHDDDYDEVEERLRGLGYME